MNKYKIIIISNSAYSYLWEIINDLTTNIENINICLDENLKNFKFNQNINIIYYNKKNNYSKRLYEILSQIDEEYVILLHDIDLILNFDKSKIIQYFNLMQINNIDRLSFGVYDNPNNIIEQDDISICKLEKGISKNYFTPFDHTPSFYKKDKLISIYKNFENETYPGIEQNQYVQEFVENNMKCYGIQKNKNINLVYHRGFVFSSDISFLHLTIRGKFLPKKLYYDLEEKVNNIIMKYNLEFVGSHQNHHYIDKNIL